MLQERYIWIIRLCFFIAHLGHALHLFLIKNGLIGGWKTRAVAALSGVIVDVLWAA